MKRRGGTMEDALRSIDEHGMRLFLGKLQTITDYLLEHLTPRETVIIEMNIFKRKTFREIGRLLSISAQRVHQIEARALAKLSKKRREKA